MVPAIASPFPPLSDLVLQLVPAVHDSPTPARQRDTLHEGLGKVTSSLRGDSFALLQFTAGGTFDVRISAGRASRALASPSARDGHLLLRRLASARAPLGLGRHQLGPTGATLEELGVDWVVGLPARSATRSRGVLVVTGRGLNPPGSDDLRPLAALSGSLAMALDPANTDRPSLDPVDALRAGPRRSVLSRWVSEFLGRR